MKYGQEVSRIDSEDGRTTTVTYSDGSVAVEDHGRVYICPLGHQTVHYPKDRPWVCPVCDMSPLVMRRTD